MHRRVLVELPNLGQQLGLGDAPVQLEVFRLDADQLSSLHLHPDVDIAVLATTDLGKCTLSKREDVLCQKRGCTLYKERMYSVKKRGCTLSKRDYLVFTLSK